MVVYDDTSTEQLRVFDRGVDLLEPKSFGEHQLAYRSGDILSPRLPVEEPLRRELHDFLKCIREGCEPRSTPELGLDVMQMVEAAEHSLRYNGAPVPIDPGPGERRRLPDRRQGSVGGLGGASAVGAVSP